MKYFIIAGEASGDLHGSNLVSEINKLDANAEIVGWGGDKMSTQGMHLLKHYSELAFMGFIEVVRNLKTIMGFFRECKRAILKFKPDVVILIDYPGFNLRLAKFIHKKKIKVFYYISPKLWAWNQRRANKIRRRVDKMFTIFPFETEFYKKFDVEVDFVGNPLLDEIEKYTNSYNDEEISTENTIAFLPGSRKQEINRCLPVMLSIMDDFKEFNFIIAGSPGIDEDVYLQYIKGKKVSLTFDKTYHILKKSKAAVITSGTATLEAALLNIPQVVCYKASKISYKIGKRLIRVKFISLVNLILNKKVVTELIQDDFNTEKLKYELNQILIYKKVIDEMYFDYNLIREKLGGAGASKRAAKLMVEYLKNEHK